MSQEVFNNVLRLCILGEWTQNFEQLEVRGFCAASVGGGVSLCFFLRSLEPKSQRGCLVAGSAAVSTPHLR